MRVVNKCMRSQAREPKEPKKEDDQQHHNESARGVLQSGKTLSGHLETLWRRPDNICLHKPGAVISSRACAKPLEHLLIPWAMSLFTA